VYPKHLGKVAGVLLILTLLVVGDVCRTRGRNALSAAAVPLLGAVVLAFTLCFCMTVWWPCKPSASWFPSVSELGANAPIRNVYRVGFLVFALLFASTNGLFQELWLKSVEFPAPMDSAALAARQAEIEMARSLAAAQAAASQPAETSAPAQSWYGWLVGSPAPAPVSGHAVAEDAVATAAEEASAGDAMEDAATTAGADDTAATAAETEPTEDNITVNSTENTTKEPRRNSTNEMLIAGPERSVMWGYVAAGGAALQAVVSFDGKFSISIRSPLTAIRDSWRSVFHSLGMLVFTVGVFQHSTQSHFWLTLPWGKTLVDTPASLQTVLKYRQAITEYGSLVLMLGPMTSQFWSTSQRANMQRNRQSLSMGNIFRESGIEKSVSLMLWAVMLLVVVFYGSFACDLWYAIEHPRAAPMRAS